MKQLYLVRHAKSSWKYSRLDDFERPLNHRGRKDAPAMGTVLKKRKVSPDLILSSPASRAAMTTRILAARMGHPLEKVVYPAALYETDKSGIIDIIHRVGPDVDRLMIVGHNPDITRLANHCGSNPVNHFPTCGVYAIRLEVTSWKKIGRRRGKTEFFDFPKKYRSGAGG